MEIPHLRRDVAGTQLIVGGRPFLILGGELGNSNASSPEFLDDLWAGLVGLRLNTVLVPVYWELIEPEEGRFDFSSVDAAIKGARRNGLRLIPLWFGTWKNSMSCYAPAWVKTDPARFPRAELAGGRRTDMLSAFSDENLRADARAFAALMRHLREFDGDEQTVIMVQVENEVGMLDDAADRSEAARRAFNATDASYPSEEAFMAFHYADYVNRVAKAGKAEYPLPMFVNVALNRPDKRPGEYPGGGALPHLLDTWRRLAPAIDFFAPDIYFGDVAHWCDAYARPDNPLFIPEIANREACAVEAFYAIGRHRALGFSPFAVDSMGEPSRAALAAAYDVLGQLAPLIAESGPGQMSGVLLDDETPSAELALGGNELSVRHDYTWEWASPARATKPWPRAGALVISTAPDEYVVAGNGVIVTFPFPPGVGILSCDEGHYRGRRFVPGRRLNGDETHQGRHLRLPCGTFGIQRLRLYRYGA